MPSKHIEKATWKKVQESAVKAVIQTEVNIKETEFLKLLIMKGLSTITEEEIQEFADKKSKEP